MLIIRGSIPPLSHTSSWCGVYFSTGKNLPFPSPFEFQSNGFCCMCLNSFLVRTVHTVQVFSLMHGGKICSLKFHPFVWIMGYKVAIMLHSHLLRCITTWPTCVMFRFIDFQDLLVVLDSRHEIFWSRLPEIFSPTHPGDWMEKYDEYTFGLSVNILKFNT